VPETDRGISVAEPPPPPFADRFLKLPKVRQKPLQKRILEYLSLGGRPSIKAISTSLGVWRSSVQRSLKVMKREGSVKDQWVYAAPGVVPAIKAHTFHITDRGRRELKILTSTTELSEPYPLGWRILVLISHGNLVTIGPLAKIVDKDPGHVRRVMKSLQNRGLVDCLISRTHNTFDDFMTTHLYRITELGRQVLKTGPTTYLRQIRSHVTDMCH